MPQDYQAPQGYQAANEYQANEYQTTEYTYEQEQVRRRECDWT